MNERRMSTVGWFFFVAGYAFVLWAACYLGESTYMLWKYGVQETAHVLSLNHISSGTSTGTRNFYTYYYNIEINGKTQQSGFSVRLPIGADVKVLDVPSHPDFLDVGTRKSSLFELWSVQLGGPIIGALALAMFAFMIVMAPKNFRMLWSQRPTILGGSHEC